MKGLGKNKSRLGPRDPKMPARVTGGPHGARIDNEAQKGCGDMGRVDEDDGESIGSPCGGHAQTT